MKLNSILALYMQIRNDYGGLCLQEVTSELSYHISYHIVSCRVVSCHVSYHIIYHIVSYPVVSHHISYHMSYHITSFNLFSFCKSVQDYIFHMVMEIVIFVGIRVTSIQVCTKAHGYLV